MGGKHMELDTSDRVSSVYSFCVYYK